MSTEPDRTGIEIEVEVDGTRYQGWYFVGDRSVTVSSALGLGTADVEGTTPGVVARSLLRKLVEDGLG